MVVETSMLFWNLYAENKIFIEGLYCQISTIETINISNFEMQSCFCKKAEVG